MRKLKIFKSVFNFISLSKKISHNDSSKEDLSPDTLAVNPIMDPNNANLPELNFEEFEKVNDFKTVKQRRSMYNNQMSLLSRDSSENMLKSGDTLNNSSSLDSFKKQRTDSSSPSHNEFQIKILRASSGSSVGDNKKIIDKVSYLTPAHSKSGHNSVHNSPSHSSSIQIDSKTNHVMINPIPIAGNSNKGSVISFEKSPKKSSLIKNSYRNDKEDEPKQSLKGFNVAISLPEQTGAEQSEIQKTSENQPVASESSSESELSEDDDRTEGDSIDVIEEEDENEEEDEFREGESPNDEKNMISEKNDQNIPTPTELMSKGDNENITEKGRKTSVCAEEIEEIETLEDELNPQMDVNLMLDVYEDNNNLDNSKKLRNKRIYIHDQCLFYPDDFIRSSWSIILSLVLCYTCLVTPYRVAFLTIEDDTETWIIIDWVTDGIFWFDIIMNFFSAYYDYNDNLIVSKKSIAMNYISGWFIVDLIGVIPFDYIFSVSRYGNLVRVAKLPRLFKLVRMTKLLRVLKLIKERNTMIKYLMNILSIGTGFERLFVSLCSIFVFCHLACCFWFMIGDMNEDPVNWVVYYDFTDKTNFDVYIASFYWITQTVVTVGYGDIAAVNTMERSLACVYMFVGVFFYSFTIGSLSSLLSTLDSKNATFDQKLNTLIQIRNQYNIDNLLYNRVKRALKYGTMQKDDEKIDFLNDLPLNLRIKLSVIMHKNVVSEIEFFNNKPETFIALIGPYLKPFHIGKDEYIFHEGEYADEMYFIKTGSVSMVLKEYNNFEFITIEKGYYFGEVDILFGDTRKYTYVAITDLELLALSKKAFNKIFFFEFRDIGSEIYKNALKRKNRSIKVYKDALEYCKRQAEKKKSTVDKSQKSSFFGFKPQLSLAKKSASNHRESDVLFNKVSSKNDDSLFFGHNNIRNFLETPKVQEIQESEEREKLMECILEENNTTPLLSSDQLKVPEKGSEAKDEIPSLESVENNDIKNKMNLSPGLAKFTNLFTKSVMEKKNIGSLFHFEHFEDEKKKDIIAEGLEQMDHMENKMKNIENNMDEIFQFYKSLGIEVEKPSEPSIKVNKTINKKFTSKDNEDNGLIENGNKQEKNAESNNNANMKDEKNKEDEINNSEDVRSTGKKKTFGIFKSFKNKKL